MRKFSTVAVGNSASTIVDATRDSFRCSVLSTGDSSSGIVNASKCTKPETERRARERCRLAMKFCPDGDAWVGVQNGLTSLLVGEEKSLAVEVCIVIAMAEHAPGLLQYANITERVLWGGAIPIPSNLLSMTDAEWAEMEDVQVVVTSGRKSLRRVIAETITKSFEEAEQKTTWVQSFDFFACFAEVMIWKEISRSPKTLLERSKKRKTMTLLDLEKADEPTLHGTSPWPFCDRVLVS